MNVSVLRSPYAKMLTVNETLGSETETFDF